MGYALNILFVVLAILKLAGSITISWWVVFFPLLLFPVLILGGLIIAGILTLLAIALNVLTKD